jgi:hypothetical protein
MAVFSKLTTIDFAEADGPDIAEWFKQLRLRPEEMPDLECAVKVEVEIMEFDDQDVIDDYERRFGVDADIIGRLYRLLAEGRPEDAMELMAREFDLATPYQERRVWAKVTAGRTKERLHAQG